MPTPSEAPAPITVRRSIFPQAVPAEESALPPETDVLSAFAAPTESLQQSIDQALARAFVSSFLARLLQDPEPATWAWLTEPRTRSMLEAAVSTLTQRAAPGAIELQAATNELLRTLQPEVFGDWVDEYLAIFGHAARGGVPLNEIEYGELKADPLFQPHRLADLAGFYRAFGLELAEEAGERHDHVGLELEFLAVLAAKEATALELQTEAEHLAICREARRTFLREHLGRWTPACGRRLSRTASHPALIACGNFLTRFAEHECALVGVSPGSADLLLRPVDDTQEKLCDGCGLDRLPPGAARAGATL